jgi:Peptidase family S41
MLRDYLFLFILATTSSLLAQEGTPTAFQDPGNSAPPNPVSDLIQQLPSTELQEALAKLRSNYIDPNALKNPEIDETAIEGLVARLGPGAIIQTKEEADRATPVRPFKTESIYSQFGYIRVGSITLDTLPQLDSGLNEFRTAAGLILDLRTMPQTTEYALAAAIASRFVPKGEPIFKLVRESHEKPFSSSADPVYQGPIVVLVDHTDAGVPEVVAGVLREKAHALIIGEKTSGRAVEYKQFPIGKRLLLSVATTQIEMPGLPPLFPNGLAPDIAVPVDATEEANVLQLGDTKGIFDLVKDEERLHTNEAALVSGKSPDIDSFEADQAAGGTARAEPKDVMIQRSLDFLTAVGIYHGK